MEYHALVRAPSSKDSIPRIGDAILLRSRLIRALDIVKDVIRLHEMSSLPKADWTKRLGKGPFHSSVVAGDGKVYFLGIDGNCTVMATGAEAKVLATNSLPGTFYATPAISDGVIYLRAYERLFAVSGK